MDEQEQQNQQDSFLKQQGNKAKDKLKDKMKDDAKKAIKKKIIAIIGAKAAIIFGIILASTIGIIVLLAGFNKIIKGDGESKTNNAKAQAVTTTYSTNASTTGTDEDGNTVSKVTITTNANKTGYEIVYNNDPEYLEEVRENLEGETIESAEEFTDFELGLLGALMDNGADLEYYSEQELQCFDEFFKAEACTLNLDLRPNSEKQKGKKTGEYIDDYKPQKIDDLEENEVPGVILVQRTNTNSSTPITLEYKPKDGENGFDKLVESNDKNAINYFTINDEGNLVVAKWDHIKITVNGEYPENLDDSEKDMPKEEDIITTEEIPYSQYISKYKMPFEFLTQLLVITEEPDFCMELVNYVLNSKIVINIQEEETITVTDETRKYTVHSKDEKSINYEVNAIDKQIEKENNYIFKNTKDDEKNDCTNYSNADLTVEVVTTYTSHSYVFEIIEADTWIAHYEKTYGDSQTEGPTTTKSDPEADENAEYKQIESEDKYPITDEKTINKDKDVKAFIEKIQANYDSIIKVPTITVKDNIDSANNKYKTVEASGTSGPYQPYYEVKDKDGNGTGVYNLPKTWKVTTNKIPSTDKTKEIPQLNYTFGLKTTKNILTGKITYKYELETEIDPLVECKVSSLDVKQFEKIVLDNYIETSVTKYPSDPNPVTETHIYAKDKDENFEKFLLAYDNSEDAQNQINSIDSWLFEMMEENEATVELVDIVKYLLYLYDDVDRGVTELEGFNDLFNPNEFVSAIAGGSAVWNNDITKEEFVNLVKSYNTPNGSGAYGTLKWGYDKYFISNAENFFDIATSYGLDPRFIFCIGIHESYFGTSAIANEKGNFFGWGANDSNPYGDAHSFYDMSDGIEAVCKGLANNYVSPNGAWYQWIIDKGYSPKTIEGIGCRYASDTNWANAVTKHMKNIFNYEPAAIENGDFLSIAKSCHDYIRENNFYYSSAKNKSAGKYVKDGKSTGNGSIPYPNGTQYTDCSAYVTWVLYEYGYTELTSQKSSAWFMNTNAMRQMGWTVLPATQAQAGDIVAKTGHVEIYAGNGQFYNAGSTNAIRKEISNSGEKYLNNFTYAIRVTPPQ